MDPLLQAALKSAGWHSGMRRASLATRRAGIDFEISEDRGTEGRLELRYHYRTEATFAEGEVSLAEDATRSVIEDAMTTIYLRIHERPDPSRVFGGGRSPATNRRGSKPAAPPSEVSAPVPDPHQGTLDF